MLRPSLYLIDFVNKTAVTQIHISTTQPTFWCIRPIGGEID